MNSPSDQRANPWWRSAVFYQIYIRSFADSTGTGVGDLAGIRSRLDHVRSLGVDAIWLTPFYPSPQHDHGYDVANYRGVDALFGTMDDFDGLLADIHAAGMRLVVDVVPNHTSSDHEWFQNAISDPDHPDRDMYIFRPGRSDGNPPNNWGSIFGGPAWSKDPAGTGLWYLHLFAPEQPDLDWRNPRVEQEMEDVLRFWLDKGVDGFRIDVAHGLLKHPELLDNPEWPDPDPDLNEFERLQNRYNFDQEDVHDVYRSWRRLVDTYAGDRVLVGEVFLWEPERVARYVRPDELHQAFNFLLLGQEWELDKFRFAIETTLKELAAVEAAPTWVLSNHDVARQVARFGGGALGRQRARAALMMILALPGAVFLYQGEELGLDEVDVPADRRQDPVERHPGIKRKGRDGRRVPIPWTVGGSPGHGFTTGDPWLPPPADWGDHSVEALDSEDSILGHYRRSIGLRQSLPALEDGACEWVEVHPDCLGFARIAPDGRRVTCIVNMGSDDVRIDGDGDLVLASHDDVAMDGGRLLLPSSSAAWMVSDPALGAS